MEVSKAGPPQPTQVVVGKKVQVSVPRNQIRPSEATEGIKVGSLVKSAALASAAREASELQDRIEALEDHFEREKLGAYRGALRRGNREGLDSQLTEITAAYNTVSKALFEEQQKTLAKLNGSIGQLDELERRIELRDSSTSTRNLAFGRMRLFAAAVEKRLALLDKQAKLKVEIRLNPSYLHTLLARYRKYRVDRQLAGRSIHLVKERGRLYRQYKIIIKFQELVGPDTVPVVLRNLRTELFRLDEQLGKAPSVAYLEQIASEIEKESRQPVRALEPEVAKRAYRRGTAQLQWGTDHLNKALASPGNWPITRRIAIMRSQSDKRYVFATEIEPMNNNGEGLVPAGLRGKPSNKERPANFQRTTFYMVGNRRDSQVVSYRGGQFPTVKAAERALDRMTSAQQTLHVSSLLTPTLIPVVKDRKLLAQHFKSITTALEKRNVSLVFTNFGVNEGAQGELWDLPALGWHHAIGRYNNDGIEQLKQSIEAKHGSLDDAELAELAKAVEKLADMWQSNAFASGRAGNDQMKFPATMKVIDHLLDNISYVNCMSGKDRTGETEAGAHWRWAEIRMRLAESGAAPDRGQTLKRIKSALGRLRRKRIAFRYQTGTRGIESDTPPVRQTPGAAERHRQAENRRQMFAGSGACAITLENTGHPGVKLHSTEPMVRYSAGFDRDYVADQARSKKGVDTEYVWKLAHCDRLDPATKDRLAQTLSQLPPTRSALIDFLEEVEAHQRRPLTPMTKVKA